MNIGPSRGLIICGIGGLVIALAVFSARSGADQIKPPDAPASARQIIVAIDLSGSRSDVDFNVDRQLLDQVVDNLEPNDQIVLIRVDDQARSRGNGWSATIPPIKTRERPTSIERQEINDVKDDVRFQVDQLFEHRDHAKSTATNLFASLFTVADYVHQSRGRRPILVIFSDMIQDSQGISFERITGVPNKSWIDQQQNANLIAGLTGVCVSVVGADPSTARGVAIRDFWEAYFKAAGANFSGDRYRQTVTEFQTLLCREE